MPRRSGIQAVRRHKKASTSAPERITTLAYANPVKRAVMSPLVPCNCIHRFQQAHPLRAIRYDKSDQLHVVWSTTHPCE